MAAEQFMNELAVVTSIELTVTGGLRAKASDKLEVGKEYDLPLRALLAN